MLVLSLIVIVLSCEHLIPLLIVRRDPERVLDILLPSFDAIARVLIPLTYAMLRMGTSSRRRNASGVRVNGNGPQPPPPAEVASLNLSRSAPASPVATLAWSGVSDATSYNVFRGTLAGLGDLACFTTGVTGTSSNDDGAVPAKAYYYLVASVACGQSGLGSGQPGPRPLPPTCP